MNNGRLRSSFLLKLAITSHFVLCEKVLLFILSCRFPISFRFQSRFIFSFCFSDLVRCCLLKHEWWTRREERNVGGLRRRVWMDEVFFNGMESLFSLFLCFFFLLQELMWAHLNCKFLTLVSRSACPTVYCSITSFTSYGLSASRNFLRAEKYCS